MLLIVESELWIFWASWFIFIPLKPSDSIRLWSAQPRHMVQQDLNSMKPIGLVHLDSISSDHCVSRIHKMLLFVGHCITWQPSLGERIQQSGCGVMQLSIGQKDWPSNLQKRTFQTKWMSTLLQWMEQPMILYWQFLPILVPVPGFQPALGMSSCQSLFKVQVLKGGKEK